MPQKLATLVTLQPKKSTARTRTRRCRCGGVSPCVCARFCHAPRGPGAGAGTRAGRGGPCVATCGWGGSKGQQRTGQLCRQVGLAGRGSRQPACGVACGVACGRVACGGIECGRRMVAADKAGVTSPRTRRPPPAPHTAPTPLPSALSASSVGGRPHVVHTRGCGMPSTKGGHSLAAPCHRHRRALPGAPCRHVSSGHGRAAHLGCGDPQDATRGLHVGGATLWRRLLSCSGGRGANAVKGTNG